MGQRNAGGGAGQVALIGGALMSLAVSAPLAEATPAPAAVAEPPVARRGGLRAPVELEVIIPAYNESGRLPETLR